MGKIKIRHNRIRMTVSPTLESDYCWKPLDFWGRSLETNQLESKNPGKKIIEEEKSGTAEKGGKWCKSKNSQSADSKEDHHPLPKRFNTGSGIAGGVGKNRENAEKAKKKLFRSQMRFINGI